MSDLLRLITLQDANTRTVLLGAGVLGLACGVIGSLAVLRRRALLGDAVAHAALPGVCAAYFVVGERSLGAFMIGALVFGLLAAGLIAAIRTLTRVREDAATAIAIGGFFGFGIAWSKVIQNQPGAGNRAGLDSFLFGKAAAMVGSDAGLIMAAGAAVLAIAMIFSKEFKLLCFDRGYAESIWGGPRAATAVDLLLMALISVCVVVGLPAVGVVLIVSLLVIPAAAARFWSDRMGRIMAISGGFGLASGVIGSGLSAVRVGVATGPAITLTAAGLFVLSMLLAPRRGVVAGWILALRTRQRVGVQNLLRRAYESLEARRAFDAVLPATDLLSHAADPSLRRAGSLGLIAEANGAGYRLTRYGLSEAAKVVRAHRLWEAFLIGHASIAPDHVHRDADEVEHVLPPELIAELESRLQAEGRLPPGVHDPAVPAEKPA